MREWLYRDFDAAKTTALNGTYSKLAEEAEPALTAFDAAAKSAEGTDLTALKALKEKLIAPFAEVKKHGVKSGHTYVANAGAEKEFQQASADYSKAEGELKSFLSGKKVEGIEATVSDALKEKFVAAEAAAAKVTKPVNGMTGIVRTQEKGWSAAFKKNAGDMNFFKSGQTLGQRGKAFAHTSLVVGAAVGVGDALFRGKTSDGEDRSGSARVLEAVVAGSVGAAALLGGRATGMVRI